MQCNVKIVSSLDTQQNIADTRLSAETVAASAKSMINALSKRKNA